MLSKAINHFNGFFNEKSTPNCLHEINRDSRSESVKENFTEKDEYILNYLIIHQKRMC